MRKVAILTSGGDAPGMNACIRSIVLTAKHYNWQVVGYQHGYNGLIEQSYMRLQTCDVENIIQRGGTLLHSARCPEFLEDCTAEMAAKNLDVLGIDVLIVIGGDGSFRGAIHLGKFWQGKIIGIPGTIDNDINGTDSTIGYHTAIDTALSSIDKVRDTADAFERVFLVEVMGRRAGFIGLSAALASAADHLLVPEIFTQQENELNNITEHVKVVRERNGPSSFIVVITEHLWPDGISKLAVDIEEITGYECRPVILGHVQRGGSPVSQDRLLATKLGAYALECAIEGKTNVMVGEQNNQLVCVDLAIAGQPKELDSYALKLQQSVFDVRENN